MATAFTLFTDPHRYASNAWSTEEAEIDRWTNEGGALCCFRYTPNPSGTAELPARFLQQTAT
jgi:hypothetical protein